MQTAIQASEPTTKEKEAFLRAHGWQLNGAVSFWLGQTQWIHDNTDGASYDTDDAYDMALKGWN